MCALFQVAGTEGAHAAARDVTVTLAADDNISGVFMMQIAEDKENPPAAIPFVRVFVFNTAAPRLWVRVQDRALNWSAWVSVLVGGAPIIQDPLAKPTYTPVALTPYVPGADTSTTPPPSTPPSSGGGGGGFAGAPALVITPPTAGSLTLNESGTVAESVTVAASLDGDSIGAKATDSAIASTSMGASEGSPNTAGGAISPLAGLSTKVIPTPSTPIKALLLPSKIFTTVALKFGYVATATSPLSKPLKIDLPVGTSATGLKASLLAPSGKNYALQILIDKKSKKPAVAQIQFLQKGTYVVTITSGSKRAVVKVRVT